ncbi:MAG: export ABC transporter ATP-binding protein [Bacteroidetes bacterium 4572_77]|nr:MAG: export ABC transporter ATP-binding protein [Bacteroidetes bacterium 4572_77]
MIEIKNISKSFGALKALNNLSIKVEKGEFYSLLGPNGAGKTSCINMIGGLLQASSGDIFIDGKSVFKESKAIKSKIGIVPQEIALYNDLSALENLRFWGKINGVKKEHLSARIEQILAFLDLSAHQQKNISTFSGGMKRRINIAAALLHEPQVLFMDEPTVGIDPQSRLFIYEIFEKLHQQGITIFYTSHNMEEVERLSDRIGIIDHGQLIAEGSMTQLKKEHHLHESLEISWKAQAIPTLLEPWLKENFASYSLQKNQLNIDSHKPTQDLVIILQQLEKHGLHVQSAEVKKVNLESLFLALTGKKLRE